MPRFPHLFSARQFTFILLVCLIGCSIFLLHSSASNTKLQYKERSVPPAVAGGCCARSRPARYRRRYWPRDILPLFLLQLGISSPLQSFGSALQRLCSALPSFCIALL